VRGDAGTKAYSFKCCVLYFESGHKFIKLTHWKDVGKGLAHPPHERYDAGREI
jgi:hypothetical protein